ncbi:hypothetical protein HNQ77_001104 [Silvibacterium bohemicum]|uniref:Uncharacterized protein n=1 Tax=Silvibacterium bohemicum TaxID=1577686 RepID=A0A841JPU0_9BACT|nr:hypothetical protein [Silvibacterium bohemicum]MBB6143160.1 hypothetical protein [Silvibacterium bohemicum]
MNEEIARYCAQSAHQIVMWDEGAEIWQKQKQRANPVVKPESMR